jgi:ATP-dependent RNA helicase DeaD
MNKFEQLGLSESLLKAILDLGFENPTEVQEKAIPLIGKRHRYGCVGSNRDRENGSIWISVIQKIDADNRIHKH